jgi:ABC-type multidrug transport system fused ATPase/permease subunit
MVVERLFKLRWIERRPVYSLFMGIIFALISFLTSLSLFINMAHLIGIVTIIFIVVLAINGVNRLFDLEERREAKAYAGFFKEHEEILDFFIYFFIGVFLVFFVIALIQPGMVFSTEGLYETPDIAPAKGSVMKISANATRDPNMPPPPPMPSSLDSEQKKEMVTTSFFVPGIFSIFQNNLIVMLICFVLSLVYSSGAIFLISFNASIFASHIADIIKTKAVSLSLASHILFLGCNLVVMFIHTIPELGGYFLGAIAGGVLSKAVTREKFRSQRFHRVLKDSIILLVLSVVVLFIAAVLEIKVSQRMLYVDNSCLSSTLSIVIMGLLVLFLLVIFELHRKKQILRKLHHLLRKKK